MKNPPRGMADPHDTKVSLEQRARAYLHVNCSHCHQMGAGGTADIDLRYDTKLGETKTLGVRPVQGTFEIPGAHIISPGDPYGSVLYYRMAKLGRGRMPHIGSEIVDDQGVHLIHDWIKQLKQQPVVSRQEQLALVDGLCASGATQGKDRSEMLQRLLGNTSSALMLAHAVDEKRVSDALRPQVLTAAMASPDAQIRDLFERFIPDEQRVKRLGSAIKPEQILMLKGDAARGKELFFKSSGLQCVNCHRIAGTGSTLGPDLSEIGKKYSRGQILESILEPSKSIDPKYVSYLAETADGQVQTGLLVEKNDREVVLKTVGDKEIRIAAQKVTMLVPQSKSLMPELLLRDLTAEQAADLLEFLTTRK